MAKLLFKMLCLYTCPFHKFMPIPTPTPPPNTVNMILFISPAGSGVLVGQLGTDA